MRKAVIGVVAALCVVAQQAEAEQTTTKSEQGKAASSPVAGLSQKYDTSLPVEISSDTLEVLQQESKAIFKGNVIAVQGKIRLKADTMIVHYKQKDDKKPGAAPAPVVEAKPQGTPASADAGAMGAITLIEVEGNVLVVTPEESAKGDKGKYEVPEKMLHLSGDNVVLTRDKNILRGTELVYNLETGHSVLTNNGSKVGGTNGGRVRGVFVPNQDKDKEKGKGKEKGNEKAAAKEKAATDAAKPEVAEDPHMLPLRKLPEAPKKDDDDDAPSAQKPAPASSN